MTDAPPRKTELADHPPAYTMWAAWGAPTTTSAPGLALERIAGRGVTVRGVYDLSGMRSGSRLLTWFHGPDLAALQEGYRDFRTVGGLAEVWSAVGVHREAEFSRAHAPAFLRGLSPKRWVTVYPFVRSYDWYLLPDDDRRAMLAEHGRMGSEHPGVQANTVAAFALGDYEWMLALEADDPIELVDLMRHLRGAEARRHVREEVPFFTGRRIEAAEIDGAVA